MKYNWKLIKETENSKIYVDYKRKKTKIETIKNIYIHNGIYPFQDYNNLYIIKRKYN